MKIVKILFFAGLVAASSPAFAGAEQDLQALFTVTGVRVDVTESSASTARTMAMDEAYSQSFHTVMQRIALPDQYDRVPNLPPDQLETLVSEVVVVTEKSSPQRYLATLNISFNPDLVNNFLNDIQVEHISRPAPRLLLLPLVNRPPQLWLWERTNPWLKAWRDVNPDTFVTPVTVPALDGPTPSLTLEEALLRQPGTYMEWARSQGADGVLFTDITQTPRALTMTVYRIDDAGMHKLQDLNLDMTGNTYRTAVRTVLDILQKDYRTNRSMQAPQDYALDTLVVLRAPKDWQTLKQKLDKLKIITHYELRALKNTKAQVTLRTSAPLDQVKTSLGRSGFEVIDLQNGILRLDYME
jgi:hypothetical protein